MIPAAFEYHRPSDIRSALDVLTAHGDEARVIAGGHSLIPHDEAADDRDQPSG